MNSFVLVVAIYTSLGGQFDRQPHNYAWFATYDECKTAADHFESRGGGGSKYVGVCAERSKLLESMP